MLKVYRALEVREQLTVYSPWVKKVIHKLSYCTCYILYRDAINNHQSNANCKYIQVSKWIEEFSVSGVVGKPRTAFLSGKYRWRQTNTKNQKQNQHALLISTPKTTTREWTHEPWSWDCSWLHSNTGVALKLLLSNSFKTKHRLSPLLC